VAGGAATPPTNPFTLVQAAQEDAADLDALPLNAEQRQRLEQELRSMIS